MTDEQTQETPAVEDDDDEDFWGDSSIEEPAAEEAAASDAEAPDPISDDLSAMDQVDQLDPIYFDALAKNEEPDPAAIRAKFDEQRKQAENDKILADFSEFQKEELIKAGFDPITRTWQQRVPPVDGPDVLDPLSVEDNPSLSIANRLTSEQFHELMALTATDAGGAYRDPMTVSPEAREAYLKLKKGT